MYKCELVGALSLASQAIQTFNVLGDPRAVFPTDKRVETRDTLRWDVDVTGREAPNSEEWFIEAIFANNLPIHLQQDTRFDRNI